MDDQERQLITDLFDRMHQHGPVEKDAAAAQLISQQVRQLPDAAYMLVQSVLVQEMALQQADERVRALEAQVEALEASRQRGAVPSNSGGFLGGMFGGGSRQPEPRPAATSRPAMSRSSMPGGLPQRQAPQQPASPWGQQPQQAAGSGGGGFMRSAMATAAGVAGGMLLADGIRSMMGSGSTAQAAGGATSTASADQAADDAADASNAEYQDPADNDPGYDNTQDAGYDDGGGDFGGMDV